MKLIVRALVVVVLTVHCLQAMNPQPVRASKKDPKNTKKMTVKITTPDGKTEISKATFNKNTDKFGSKKPAKGSTLFFDWNKGGNLIKAFYNDEPTEIFGLSVSKDQASSPGSEILIEDKNITIKAGITAPEPLQSPFITAVATILEDPKAATWHIASGTEKMTKSMAHAQVVKGRSYPEVLQGVKVCTNNTCDLSIYTSQPTKIYTERKAPSDVKSTTNMTTLTAQNVKEGGVSLEVIIDAKGKAKIVSQQEKDAEIKKAQDAEDKRKKEAEAKAEAELKKAKEVKQSARTALVSNLPAPSATIRAKALFVGDQKYSPKTLVNTDGSLKQDLVDELMNITLTGKGYEAFIDKRRSLAIKDMDAYERQKTGDGSPIDKLHRYYEILGDQVEKLFKTLLNSGFKDEQTAQKLLALLIKKGELDKTTGLEKE